MLKKKKTRRTVGRDVCAACWWKAQLQGAKTYSCTLNPHNSSIFKLLHIKMPHPSVNSPRAVHYLTHQLRVLSDQPRRLTRGAQAHIHFQCPCCLLPMLQLVSCLIGVAERCGSELWHGDWHDIKVRTGCLEELDAKTNPGRAVVAASVLAPRDATALILAVCKDFLKGKCAGADLRGLLENASLV